MPGQAARDPSGAGADGAIPPPERRDPTRFAFVDCLRGVAAMWIVVFHGFAAKHFAHLEPLLPSWSVRVIFAAPIGVAVFFVLSGFVIAHVVGRDRVDARYALRFVARRRARLDPPYLMAIALVLAVGNWVPLPPESLRHPTATSLLAHALYLQDLLGIEAMSPVFWSLCLEVQFYVVFCVLLAIADRRASDGERQRARLGVAAVAAIVSIAIIVPPAYRWAWRPLFPSLWFTFLAGTFAAWAFAGTLRPGWFYAYVAALLLVALARGNRFALAAAATSMLLLAAARSPRLAAWLDWRPLGALGTVSYSLYLVHSPVTAVVANYTLYALTPRTAAWEGCWLVVFLVTSYAAAVAFHRAVERPAIRLSHRLAPSARWRRDATTAPAR